tara:strand:+ start:43 stop:1422 length:1380 start_codon:yes stop_codon:yes gene_type:complete
MTTKYYETLQEKEINILRDAVDKADQKQAKKIINSQEIKTIFNIVEKFIKDKSVICYGGTAINNILPIKDQFYSKNTQLPDYDFFSKNALNDAKNLADIYLKNGFEEVEAKSGIHLGTYKVFVNFIPIADITQIDTTIFNNLKKNSIIIDNIHYAPPNYLKMASYLELSRPAGDISRWEKVLKRLTLLNKNFPIKGKDCHVNKFIKNFNNNKLPFIFTTIKNIAIDEGLVFFGGFALMLFNNYTSPNEKKLLSNNPSFDLLSENPKKTLDNIIKKLTTGGFKDIQFKKHDNIGEIIPYHYILKVNNNIVAFIYEPIACHSYNIIHSNNKIIKIATIDTMLSFYLAFLYSNKEYYNENRILCIAEYLFKIQARNRFKQKGVLKRFSISCYGKQQTLANVRAQKAKKFRELKNKKNSKEYEKYFLRYIPFESKKVKSKKVKSKKVKSKKIKSKKVQSKKIN